MKSLIVILKTVERCNLNCSYCYFFNGGDESYKKHPPIIKKDTLQAISSFLKKGCEELGIDSLHLSFHGGEPILQSKEAFCEMCDQFQKDFFSLKKVDFNIQTNGILLDEEWINIFSRYKISVGISLDGPKHYHDRFRLDHQGKGSYEKTREKIALLQKAATEGKIPEIGVLSVINPSFDPKVIYRHFVDDLNIRKMDFLLPDACYEDFNPDSSLPFGQFLCGLFDEWTQDNNPQIVIRTLQSMMRVLLGKQTTLLGIGSSPDTHAITISSQGDLSPDDTLRSINPSFMQLSNVNVCSLREFLDLPVFHSLKQARQELPQECQRCCWSKVCQGGMEHHRFSKKNNFNNPSVMCSGLKKTYSHIAAYLLKNGLAEADLIKILF